MLCNRSSGWTTMLLVPAVLILNGNMDSVHGDSGGNNDAGQGLLAQMMRVEPRPAPALTQQPEGAAPVLRESPLSVTRQGRDEEEEAQPAAKPQLPAPAAAPDRSKPGQVPAARQSPALQAPSQPAPGVVRERAPAPQQRAVESLTVPGRGVATEPPAVRQQGGFETPTRPPAAPGVITETPMTQENWYGKPAGLKPGGVVESPASSGPWYQQVPSSAASPLPGAAGAGVERPGASRQHPGSPLHGAGSDSPSDRYGIGGPGGDRGMPQRDVPHRHMGPASSASQPSSGSPLDGRLGPGSVMSGGRYRSDRTTEDGTRVRAWESEEGDYYVRQDDPDGTTTIRVFRSDGTKQEEIYQPTNGEGSSGQQQEEEIPLVRLVDDGTTDDEEEESTQAESSPGDPDGWGSEEGPPDQFGVGGGIQVRGPRDDGRAGGDGDDGRESAHAPRPDLDVEQQIIDRAGQVGDRRERGPRVQMTLPEDHLRDPPQGATGSR